MSGRKTLVLLRILNREKYLVLVIVYNRESRNFSLYSIKEE